ncbi:FecR domain-containing protein [Fulvivirgaceae bacterium BMA10]|uniref:FecR domain-containing protein n=1 Tax=Splendidivirga corallicola TaxID=3051826 RepID=A0ABT8KN69_9BACT|nr:FecR domain-containing protein [Fulvivirgaceae bacterium BMA10]
MKQEDLRLFKKYLEGSTSQEENLIIRNMMFQFEEDEGLKQLLLEEWRQTSSKNELSLDMDEAWQEIKKVMLNNNDFRLPTRPTKTIRWPGMAVAASVVLAVAIGTLFFPQWFDNDTKERIPVEAVYIQKQTGKGEKLNISLPDGSFIKLNSSTRLSIPSNYHSNDEREVYLEGEAFFEIAKFEKKPFKVITGEVTTTVLGTSFNVKAPSNDKKVSVALVEGKVKVANANGEIILDTNEMTTVQSSTDNLSKSSFDVEEVTGWRNNLLIFNEVPFYEIIEKLEQWYGVEIEIKGDPVADKKYSGRFENKSLALVLEGLGFSSAFDYEIKDKSVFLNFKK